MSHQDPSFKKLQKEWYQKLKDSGFNDLENAHDNYLKQFESRRFLEKQGQTTLNPEAREAIQNYYIKAEHFLNAYNFESKADKLIWKYHASGKSIREIVIALQKEKIKISRNPVHLAIKRLRKLMIETDGNESRD